MNNSPHQGVVNGVAPVGIGGGQSASTATSASNARNSSALKFDALEQTLEMFVENARHLCVIVSDFPGGSSGPTSGTWPSNAGGGTSNGQAVLNQKLQTLVSGLQELDAIKHQFQDVKIPIELFEQYVDAGRNPQLYTKECMERTLVKNKRVNGKIELYKKFRAHLLKELSEEFPKETMRYRTIRETGVANASGGSANGTINRAESDSKN